MSGILAYQAMLLGAQAAGIGANIFAAYQQRKMVESGIAVDQGDLKLRMKQEELAYTEANVESLGQLQEVMATQRAIMGARGQNPGVGSALAAANKSVRAQSADQAARDLSKSFRQAQLSGMSGLLNIKKAGARATFGNSLIEGGLSTLDLNTTIGELIQKNKQSIKPIGGGTQPNWKNKDFLKPQFALKGRVNG